VWERQTRRGAEKEVQNLVGKVKKKKSENRGAKLGGQKRRRKKGQNRVRKARKKRGKEEGAKSGGKARKKEVKKEVQKGFLRFRV